MTKDWSIVEDEARRLYSEGMSLQKLRTKLSDKYDFHASTRAWRNKIKEWGLKKHRPSATLARSRCPKGGVETLDQQWPSPSVSSSVEQVARQDQVSLNDEHAQLTLPCADRPDESAIVLSSHVTAVVPSGSNDPNRNMDLQGSEDNFQPFGSIGMPRKSNEAICERLKHEYYDKGVYGAYDILDNIRFKDGEESLLHYVAFQGHLGEHWCTTKIVLNYMAQYGYPLNTLDRHGQTALEIAIKSDNVIMVHRLCNEDPSLADVDHREGSLLHIAVLYSSRTVCCDLAKHSKHRNKKNALGTTPIQLAARRGRDDVVATLLDFGATIDNEDMAVVLVRSRRLETECCIDLLKRGLLMQMTPNEVGSTCRRIVMKTLKDEDLCTGYDWTTLDQSQVPRFLELIFRAYPEVLWDETYNQEQFFPAYQRLMENAVGEAISQAEQDSIDRLLRLLLQRGFSSCVDKCLPYTGSPVTDYPDVTYIHIKALVETCNIAISGQDVFRLICFLLNNEDPYDLWVDMSYAQLAGLLQTLLNRGLRLDHSFNVLSCVLRHVPEKHNQLKISLVKTILEVHNHSRMVACHIYGHPLDMLARTPEPSRWRYAELLLDDDTMTQLLGVSMPAGPLVLSGIAMTPSHANLAAYTYHQYDLQRCVLHVLTRTALEKLSVFPGDSHIRLVEVMSIRRAFKLPEVSLKLSSDGHISLIGEI